MEDEVKLKEAAQFFNIGTITNSKETAFGIGNENYIVETTQGVFVLRRLWEQTIDGLQNEIAIQQQLATVGIPTAHLISGKNGKYYFQLSDQVITASKKIEGQHPEVVNQPLAKRLGSLLAKFHQAVTYLPLERPRWLNKEEVFANAGKIGNHPLKEEIIQRLKENLDLFNHDLPTGIIHGDLYTGNILLTPEDQLVVFDLEMAEKNLLIIDIARALLSMGHDESFLEGYQEIRKLTKAELQNLYKAKLYTSAAVAAWLVDRNQDGVAKKIFANAIKN
jgi:Ser/Thr protein kinase RdoA (MazF antagonist)